MKPYKAIFLDWDDTIGDWTTAEHKALQDIYRTYQLDRLYPTFEDYLNAYKPYNLELWGMYGRGEVTKEKLHFERFYRPIEGLPVTGDELRKLAHDIGGGLFGFARMNPDLVNADGFGSGDVGGITIAYHKGFVCSDAVAL